MPTLHTREGGGRGCTGERSRTEGRTEGRRDGGTGCGGEPGESALGARRRARGDGGPAPAERAELLEVVQVAGAAAASHGGHRTAGRAALLVRERRAGKRVQIARRRAERAPAPQVIAGGCQGGPRRGRGGGGGGGGVPGLCEGRLFVDPL